MTTSPRDLPEVIITIDGPAGTGKSTVAHRLARQLGLEFLDTGAMYRAAALIAIEQDVDPHDGPSLAAAVRAAEVHFDWEADPPRLLLHGDRDISDRVRDFDVSAIVSIVAAQPELRAVLVDQQRAIAARHPRLVSEGRDQGSIVFPDAILRFYLDADVEVRAGRRIAQLAATGRDVDAQRVVHDIQQRDHLDATRPDGPLVRPHGAIEIDTSRISITQVVAQMEGISREHLRGAELLP